MSDVTPNQLLALSGVLVFHELKSSLNDRRGIGAELINHPRCEQPDAAIHVGNCMRSGFVKDEWSYRTEGAAYRSEALYF